MNSWCDQMIANLELKQAELERQLAGIKNAVLALKEGYDHPIIQLPEMFRPNPPQAPSVYINPDGAPEQHIELETADTKWPE